MAKLIFRYTDEMVEECREASEIEFKIPDDLNIHEYKIICVRLASALGFVESTIKNSFGETIHDTPMDIEFKNFIHSIYNVSSSLEN